jgi:hypothetical protein
MGRCANLLSLRLGGSGTRFVEASDPLMWIIHEPTRQNRMMKHGQRYDGIAGQVNEQAVTPCFLFPFSQKFSVPV